MAKPVSIFFGVDSGGGCPCVTPPTPLSPPVGNVFVGKYAVMANGDVLTPAVGKTCDSTPSICSSSRVVKAANFTFVNGFSISTVGNSLNVGTGIKIPKGSTSVFA
jgi:hypothetical protein